MVVQIILRYLYIGCLLIVSISAEQMVTVKAPAGDIVGLLFTVNVHGRQYSINRFLGIPYAESPTGDRRFRKPVPKAKFTSPYQALNMSEVCYQTELAVPGGGIQPATEDCLVLNVYSPVISNTSLVSVMIWIHGGGFKLGSSNIFIGDTLSAYGHVIVVTLNYRLSLYGFLSSGDSIAPGNYGLWDQHLAIKWVHNNIETFGGDKKSVTVFGESAGAASVIFQTLYPGNEGLFQRAIAESGSAFGYWAITRKPEESFVPFAEAAGCSQSTLVEKLQCLRSKPISVLNDTLNNPSKNGKAGAMNWNPVVDGEFVLEDTRLTIGADGSPMSLKARTMFASVDLLIGSNSADGASCLPLWMEILNITDSEKLSISRTDFEQKLIPFHASQFVHPRNTTDIINKAIIMEYTDWQEQENETIHFEMLTKLCSDMIFFAPNLLTADVHALQSSKSSYSYEFATAPPFHYLQIPSWFDGKNKANHADELGFVFGFDPNMKELYSENVTDDQRKVSNAMMTMWTNFAKTGNPNTPMDILPYTNVVWPQYDTQTQACMKITSDMGPSSVKHHFKTRESTMCFVVPFGRGNETPSLRQVYVLSGIRINRGEKPLKNSAKRILL